MPRDAIPLTIPDTAAFARALRNALAAEPALPGHLAFLGHIARAAGWQNWQHLRASLPPPIARTRTRPCRRDRRPARCRPRRPRAPSL